MKRSKKNPVPVIGDFPHLGMIPVLIVDNKIQIGITAK
jgi:hypothetical protein